MNPIDQMKEDTERLMKDSPGYFLAWYTLKSLALVGTVAVAAYQLGKNRALRQSKKTPELKKPTSILTTTGEVSK